MKVSGALRSVKGAEVCLALRSLIETAIKQGVDIVEALTDPTILEVQLAIPEWLPSIRNERIVIIPPVCTHRPQPIPQEDREVVDVRDAVEREVLLHGLTVYR